MLEGISCVIDLFLCTPFFLSFRADDDESTYMRGPNGSTFVPPDTAAGIKFCWLVKLRFRLFSCVRSRCAWSIKTPVSVNRCEVSETERDARSWKNSHPSKHLNYDTTVLTVDSRQVVSWDFKTASHTPASFLAPKHWFCCDWLSFQPRHLWTLLPAWTYLWKYPQSKLKYKFIWLLKSR